LGIELPLRIAELSGLCLIGLVHEIIEIMQLLIDFFKLLCV
jgi:hypothetical protein